MGTDTGTASNQTTRVGRDGLLEQHSSVITESERTLLVVINALLLHQGGMTVVADEYVLGQPLREVIVDGSKPGLTVFSLGVTEAERASGKGVQAILWTPGQGSS